MYFVPKIVQVVINDVLGVVEAVGKGVSVGKTSVSGMTSADDLVRDV